MVLSLRKPKSVGEKFSLWKAVSLPCQVTMIINMITPIATAVKMITITAMKTVTATVMKMISITTTMTTVVPVARMLTIICHHQLTGARRATLLLSKIKYVLADLIYKLQLFGFQFRISIPFWTLANEKTRIVDVRLCMWGLLAYVHVCLPIGRMSGISTCKPKGRFSKTWIKLCMSHTVQLKASVVGVVWWVLFIQCRWSIRRITQARFWTTG